MCFEIKFACTGDLVWFCESKNWGLGSTEEKKKKGFLEREEERESCKLGFLDIFGTINMYVRWRKLCRARKSQRWLNLFGEAKFGRGKWLLFEMTMLPPLNRVSLTYFLKEGFSIVSSLQVTYKSRDHRIIISQ